MKLSNGQLLKSPQPEEYSKVLSQARTMATKFNNFLRALTTRTKLLTVALAVTITIISYRYVRYIELQHRAGNCRAFAVSPRPRSTLIYNEHAHIP